MTTFSIPAFDQVVANEHPLHGTGPLVFWGTTAPDGDENPWKGAPLGSIYVRTAKTAGVDVDGHPLTYVKRVNNQTDYDWNALGGVGVLSEWITRAQFTDGGSTLGTYTMTGSIPIGAKAIGSTVTNLTGFTGDTSAVVTLSDGSDVDRYNTGTPSLFTTANAVDLGVASGTAIHVAAIQPIVRVTSAADFTNVAAGSMRVNIYYYL